MHILTTKDLILLDYISGMKIKLTKFSTGLAASFPGAMDIVFYKDEEGKHFRLKYVDKEVSSTTFIESLHRVMCVSSYAPEIIEGEVNKESSDEVNIKVGRNIYFLQKNAERFEFWDITDKY